MRNAAKVKMFVSLLSTLNILKKLENKCQYGSTGDTICIPKWNQNDEFVHLTNYKIKDMNNSRRGFVEICNAQYTNLYAEKMLHEI